MSAQFAFSADPAFVPAAMAGHGAKDVTRTEVEVSGFSGKAEIVVDAWGIPHIYAGTEQDLFFAQGFNAARDRLWQLDLWRRQGEGKLAEAFGSRFVERDRAARLFLYRGNLDKELSSYHPHAKKILTAFTSGINAYIELTRKQPALLPEEFRITGSQPGPWSVTTPLIRIFGLTRNATREVQLAQLVRNTGAQTAEKLSTFEPSTRLDVPKGLDLSMVNDRILKDYKLARDSWTFAPGDLAVGFGPGDREHMIGQLVSRSSPETEETPDLPFESNNWAISGRLTSTGKPILAGDPHRAQTVPSLRYIAHLVCPGWNVIGAGEPALPGVSLGHNERIAWALTIFSFPDEEDLYFYETNPVNPMQYRYRGGWEPMRTVVETIPIKGGSTQTATLHFTRHGPVLFENQTNHTAWALRAAYLEHPGTAAYLPSLRLNQARNWTEFLRGVERHLAPSLNMTYADVSGNIGWFGASVAPIRNRWDGLLPVPGNGEFEWEGFLAATKLPRRFNPPEGWIGTANQYNLPMGYPFTGVSAREWAAPYRYQRISEVLGSGRKMTLEDSMHLQYDDTSIPARELIALLDGLSSTDRDTAAAMKLLKGWDFVLSKSSAAAAIYEVWEDQLQKDVYALQHPRDPNDRPGASTAGRIAPPALIRLLKSPDRAFGPESTTARNKVLIAGMEKAMTMLKTRLGPDMSVWKWGDLHHIALEHALSRVVDSAHRDRLNASPLPMGGDGFTPHNTAFRQNDFRQTSGASYRQVLDLAEWDRSVALNSPGQSGNSQSPHYKDLFPRAAEGRYVPLLFSRKKVMEAAEEIFVLRPGK